MKAGVLRERIRDRLSPEWLTPSQRAAWDWLQRFDGPPHRIINIYGPRGSGKSFLGWLMQRERHATYGIWPTLPRPEHPRLVVDNAPTDRAGTRALRPKVDALEISQIILLSRQRVDEQAMPAFELHITPDDIEVMRGNLYRYLNLIVPEDDALYTYHDAIDRLMKRG